MDGNGEIVRYVVQGHMDMKEYYMASSLPPRPCVRIARENEFALGHPWSVCMVDGLPAGSFVFGFDPSKFQCPP